MPLPLSRSARGITFFSHSSTLMPTCDVRSAIPDMLRFTHDIIRCQINGTDGKDLITRVWVQLGGHGLPHETTYKLRHREHIDSLS